MKCNVQGSEPILSEVHSFLLWLYSWQFKMTRCKGRALFCNRANMVFNDLYWKLPVVCSVVLMQCLTLVPFPKPFSWPSYVPEECKKGINSKTFNCHDAGQGDAGVQSSSYTGGPGPQRGGNYSQPSQAPSFHPYRRM